jgi:hypothetical protein
MVSLSKDSRLESWSHIKCTFCVHKLKSSPKLRSDFGRVWHTKYPVDFLYSPNYGSVHTVGAYWLSNIIHSFLLITE